MENSVSPDSTGKENTNPDKSNNYQHHGNVENTAEPNKPDDTGSSDPGFKQVNRGHLKSKISENKSKNDKTYQATKLPSVMNVNPRSVYNKLEDFHTLVEVEEIDCVFMSESWERPNQPLESIIQLPDHTVVSNPHQRDGQGGRPAIIINHKKYHIRNITQSLIKIPWGTEAVWAILTPKGITKSSKIQRIAVCSFYSKPNSTSKTQLLDHIDQAFHIISSKYQRGLHFILAADSNELKLDSILSLSSQMKQMVKGFIRLNPPKND